MTSKLLESPSVLWVILILLSATSLALFEGHVSAAIGGTLIILIAALKSRLVILHYMEARRAPANWRFLYETWNFACAALLIVANLVTLAQR
ncbi:MAG: cytochrome C oxidase subunit IV family protein [Panacagrimonas sp.]